MRYNIICMSFIFYWNEHRISKKIITVNWKCVDMKCLHLIVIKTVYMKPKPWGHRKKSTCKTVLMYLDFYVRIFSQYLYHRTGVVKDWHATSHFARDDVIKWKHFPRYWPFVRGIHRSPVNSPHKGQWRGALMFSFICVWINGWVNNHEAGDLRRYHAHYDVTVMIYHQGVTGQISSVLLSVPR